MDFEMAEAFILTDLLAIKFLLFPKPFIFGGQNDLETVPIDKSCLRLSLKLWAFMAATLLLDLPGLPTKVTTQANALLQCTSVLLTSFRYDFLEDTSVMQTSMTEGIKIFNGIVMLVCMTEVSSCKPA